MRSTNDDSNKTEGAYFKITSQDAKGQSRTYLFRHRDKDAVHKWVYVIQKVSVIVVYIMLTIS